MDYLDELFGLKDKVALVTGASSGLGSHAAKALAKAGASVALVARREDRLLALAENLSKMGVRALSVPADVTENSQCERIFDETESRLGPVDILLHGAGIAKLRRAENHTREEWDTVMAIDLTAAFELSQIFTNRLLGRGQKSGRIIYLSSVMGLVANSVHRCVSYQAAKHGVHGLTKQLAIEWAKYGITVNAVAPAYFPTEMTIDPATGQIPEEMLKRMEQFTPMGRTGLPEEIETAVVFLASPASTYVTGTVVPVDGGWTAW
tara:strand:+ start:1379 stop:2170 length:792 start_codon:yes stop_codon:yes gene_type:complete